MAAHYGSLPFDEAIRFFREKKLVPTTRTGEVAKEANDSAFHVAGAMQADLLADLHMAVDAGIAEGSTLAQFAKDFEAIVETRGWTGWTGEGTRAGRAWRAQIIYETNLRTAYQAGRWAQAQEVKDRRPFLEYRHSDASIHPRELHKSWDGLVVAIDDPWVQTHWPPNGWGCKCMMFSLSQRDLAKLGKAGPDTPPDDGTRTYTDKVTGETKTVPNGIDPGWDYAPGASRAEFLRQRNVEKAKTLPGGIGEALAKSTLEGPGRGGPMISLAGIDADHADGIREVLVAFKAGDQEGRLPHGVKRLAVSDDVGISATDQRGSFTVSRTPLAGLGGRSGLETMTSALTKIKNGERLDFHEEYGLESLWHEIEHNSQAHLVQPDTPMGQLRIMEGLHQVLARQTYPKLLAALGIEPRHLRQIRESGPAYPKSAGGMTSVLRAAGLMDGAFALRQDALDALLRIDREEPFAVMAEAVAEAVTRLAGSDKAKLSGLLDLIADGEPPSFEEALEILKSP